MIRKVMIGAALLLTLVSPRIADAAVGCTLNDPDRDIRRIFPDATNFRTDFIAIDERGGDSLRAEVEDWLGDRLDKVYESNDVPYAYYTVLKGEEIIGRVHGVNQKGEYGGMQLILATDPEGTVVEFYYQKLSSPEAKAFRADVFTDQFVGISLADFGSYDSDEQLVGSRVERISDPTKKNRADFLATLRGVRKNLLLLTMFHPDVFELPDEAGREEGKETSNESK